MKKDGDAMYSENDYQTVSAQLKKRLILTGIPAVILLAAVIVLFALRAHQIIVMLLTILLGAYIIFMWGMFLHPVAAYKSHLNNVLHGRVHSITGFFKEMETVSVQREGVSFYPMTISVNDMTDEEDDRLLYYDANLPVPAWKPGDRLTFSVHDKSVGDWKPADA